MTGFGLLGHLLEICRASGVGARVTASALPKIAEAEVWAGSYVLPDNAMRNWNAFEGEVEMGDAGARVGDRLILTKGLGVVMLS